MKHPADLLWEVLYSALVVQFDCTEPNQSQDPKADWEAIKESVSRLDDTMFFDGSSYTAKTFLAELAKSGSLCPDYPPRV